MPAPTAILLCNVKPGLALTGVIAMNTLSKSRYQREKADQERFKRNQEATRKAKQAEYDRNANRNNTASKSKEDLLLECGL